jgi:hypothetical protein
MRSNPGPGGTLTMEVDGVCVTFFQRRTAEGVPVYQHGGSWGGQISDFFFVPDRQFGMTMLTNSATGSKVNYEVGRSGWALTQFCGLSNPPAVPKAQPAERLARYEGRYAAATIAPFGPTDKIVDMAIELKAPDGGLRVSGDSDIVSLAFYRDEYVLATNPQGQANRSDFVRGPDGRVAWFRDGGRLWAHQG